jgi:hypothetical protein
MIFILHYEVKETSMERNTNEPGNKEEPSLFTLLGYGVAVIIMALLTAPIILALDSGHH